MSSLTHADSMMEPPSPVTSFRPREWWILLGAALRLVTGLQLDSYAHATIPDLETFWTPWHGVLYSGIAACGFVLLWLLRPRLPEAITYRSVLTHTPPALRLPVIGMGMLLVGGGIDTLWHNLFGIEKGLEIFTSPSHYLIIGGMVLVAAGPALMLATAPARTLRPSSAVVVTASTVLASLPLHIYTQHASSLSHPRLGTGDDPMRTFSLDGQMLHGYFGSTVLLLLPILLIGRRWPLPVGMPTALVALPALLLSVMFSDTGEGWLPITVALTAAVIELLARASLGGMAGLRADTRWLLLGLLSPIVLWGSVFAVASVKDGMGWGPHVMSGVLTFAAFSGLGTAYVVRRLQPAEDNPACAR
ncbi:hypothetical protein [Mycolicibacterium goodii]|uniref:hypothetical protein n=1 Tax=Mycolicibacterium goodii TaxID=134601 RepID=UPI001BDCD332|nr:hypothetical protein [Mycolicibacterium goodii]MBU8829770.1 hypothetical protein [Mycolicibacterium goodii]